MLVKYNPASEKHNCRCSGGLIIVGSQNIVSLDLDSRCYQRGYWPKHCNYSDHSFVGKQSSVPVTDYYIYYMAGDSCQPQKPPWNLAGWLHKNSHICLSACENCSSRRAVCIAAALRKAVVSCCRHVFSQASGSTAHRSFLISLMGEESKILLYFPGP